MPNIRHAFISAKADGGDATLVRPSNWNAKLQYTDGSGAPSGSDAVVLTVLAAATTFYVRDDGSNSNTGLADTAGGAKLTWQGAFDEISQNYNVAGKTVTITNTQAAKTWTAGIDFSASWIGGGQIIIDGGGVSNTIFSVTGATFIFNNAGTFSGSVKFQDIKMVCITSGTALLNQGIGVMYLGSGCEFGACVDGHMGCYGPGAVIDTQAITYTISGGSYAHLFTYNGGRIIGNNSTVTLTGTPAFTNFAEAGLVSSIRSAGTAYTGSATGTRYSAYLNSAIDVGGGGATFYPGNVAGTTATGGQYA